MNKMIVFASLALLLSQCKPNAEIPKIPEGKEDGYVFYDGIRRFLSDGTEIEPLVTAISIDGEEIDIGSEKNRERIVSTRVSENRVECYFVPEEGSGLVFFSYDCLTGRTTEPRKVVGDPDDIGSDRVPGTRDRMCFWGPAGGPRTEGIVRDGVAYAVGRLNSVVHVSDRGEYELFDQDSTTYLAYRPFGEGGGLGERTIVRKRSLIGFVELDPSSPKRYFFAGTDDPRWYCFSEETLELEDLGPYEKDRYRF
ncbi:MAG: hypothetical protein ACI4UT_01425, partial [Candidatus Enteromonas sp.]